MVEIHGGSIHQQKSKKWSDSALYRTLVRAYLHARFSVIEGSHFFRALFTRRPVFLIGCHTGPFTGNAYHFLKYVQQRPEAIGVGMVDPRARYALVREGLPWVKRTGWMTRLLARKVSALFWTGYPSSEPVQVRSLATLRVLLWHGMTIKAVGAQSVLAPSRTQDADCCIASSSFTAEIMRKAFPIPGRQVLCTGEPKTDGLVDPDRPDVAALLGGDIQRLVLYAPTFRDVENPAPGEFADLTFNDELVRSECIREVLLRHRAAMLVAPHPVHRPYYKGKLRPPFYLSPELDLHTEHLMASACYLISDYSSVILDWLLLSRPMGLFCPDMEEYRRRRGFPYFDFETMFAPFIHSSLDSLVRDLDGSLAGNGRPPPDLLPLKTLFHQHEAGGASQRVFDQVLMLIQLRQGMGPPRAQ